ncbi:coiled-coil domain-containing protein 150 [Neopsephotus bourkii]|uniref:coiled-coil domain-containing protein 150 n=1 Tax=Neopsephotus bourkii TaxID=309878 RepID=UPI002AA5A5BB|nr:coiled-coil domain-containing protein 150 [Neopsephotus bourkii]
MRRENALLKPSTGFRNSRRTPQPALCATGAGPAALCRLRPGPGGLRAPPRPFPPGPGQRDREAGCEGGAAWRDRGEPKQNVLNPRQRLKPPSRLREHYRCPARCCACAAGGLVPGSGGRDRQWWGFRAGGTSAVAGEGPRRAAMARPIIVPMRVTATVPEAFMVLHLRMNMVEEQTSALVRDLEELGVNGQSLEHFHSETSETPTHPPAISPVQARVAFVGENTLWKNCEMLVNRMCRLESVVQTLKSNIFRLQAEKELSSKYTAQLEQCLKTVHEEHLQEMKTVQQEAMKLHQQLSDMKEAEEKAKEEVQRLSTALEITTSSKMDVVTAAEELRNTNQKINCRLQELTEQLSQEISLRQSLEESHATVLCYVQDMEAIVEVKRKQVQILHQDCQDLCKDVQLAQVRLQEEEERTAQLEQQCTQLKAELDSRNCIISQLGEETKNAQLSLSKERKENLQLQSKMTTLQETAEKVQILNDRLSQQCSELSTTLQSVAVENAKLISDHLTVLKAEQDKTHKLQEQDSLLNAAHANVLGELQSVQHERSQLQRELEALRTEHGKYRLKASLAEKASATERQLLEHTVARLQDELETALQEKRSLLSEKEDLQQEIRTRANETVQERNKLEVLKTENELEIISMKFTLQTLEQENKRLLNRLDALVHEQYAQQHVQQVLAELADSKNKLTCDKGKLQVAILQHQLDAAKDDSNKATAMLEHVLASHNKMKAALDVVQTELVHKDTEISHLRRDKSQTQPKIQILERELKHCQAKLVDMGKQHRSQVEPLCKALEKARTDKKKLVLCLEEFLQVSNTLQSKLIQTQCELKSKETENQQLMLCREQLMEKDKTEGKMCAAHLEFLQKQFQIEQEASRKATCHESAEIKKSREEEPSKLAEVSCANRELHLKVIELEKSFSSSRKKLRSQRAQVRQCLPCKANAERIKELEKTVKHLKEYKEEAEKKLKEASIDSEQIATSLKAAYRWFKSDYLQLEAVKKHQPKTCEDCSPRKEEKKHEEHPTYTSWDTARPNTSSSPPGRPRELGRK